MFVCISPPPFSFGRIYNDNSNHSVGGGGGGMGGTELVLISGFKLSDFHSSVLCLRNPKQDGQAIYMFGKSRYIIVR